MRKCLTTGCRRPGFSLLEFEVALILLGVALSGLIPLVTMYSDGVTALENRIETPLAGVPMSGAPPIPSSYLVPSSNVWACKLGAAAQVTASPPAQPAPPVLLVDDGDSAYADNGWTLVPSDSAAYNGHYRWTNTPGMTATWTFSNVPSGWYQVAATWPSDASWLALSPSGSAAYSIWDGSVALGTWTAVAPGPNPVNQQNSPSGLSLNGMNWQLLGTVLLTGPNVMVQLTAPSPNPNPGPHPNLSNLSVAASAVQLVPLQNIVTVTSLNRSLSLSGGTSVTAQATVQVMVPQ